MKGASFVMEWLPTLSNAFFTLCVNEKEKERTKDRVISSTQANSWSFLYQESCVYLIKPVQRARKFSAVFGTMSLYNSKTIRPTSFTTIKKKHQKINKFKTLVEM
jgi:hypothetical protein